jgi:plasmid maintenance system antidote protein VapI
MRLERVLGPSVGYWLNLQHVVDLYDGAHSPAAAEIKMLKPLKVKAA